MGRHDRVVDILGNSLRDPAEYVFRPGFTASRLPPFYGFSQFPSMKSSLDEQRHLSGGRTQDSTSRPHYDNKDFKSIARSITSSGSGDLPASTSLFATM